MTRLVSIRTKIEQISALAGTKDVTPWESEFCEGIGRYLAPGAAQLSEKQIEVIDRIWEKHFA